MGGKRRRARPLSPKPVSQVGRGGIGAVRPEGKTYRPLLNPPDGFALGESDRLVILAGRYAESFPNDTTPESAYSDT